VFDQKNLEQELQFNVRNALGFLERDLRLAGSGLVMGEANVSSWFSGLSGVTQIPHIVDGGSGPDSMILVGTSGAPVATLQSNESAGNQILRITPTTGGAYTYSPRVGDVLLIGGIETVQVTSVITFLGNTLVTVRTDPNDSSAGLDLDYAAGMDIFQLNVVQYSVANLNGIPGLIREDSRYGYGTEADKRLAENITDLQLSRSGDRITATVTGRTRDPVSGFTDEADGRPRYTLTTEVEVRVADPILDISSWPDYTLVATPTPTPGP
jgi:hypothetical protein